MKRGVLAVFLFAALPCPLQALSEENANMAARIEGVVAEFDPGEVEAAAVVQDANTGEVIYSLNAESLLIPASNAKILTTLAALSYLGPQFRFKTQLIGEGDIKKGELSSLTLKGFGDPSLTTLRLEEMVRQLAHQRIRNVQRLQIDETYFDQGDFPGRFDGRQREALFNTNVGALVLDHNQVEVVVTPAEQVGEPARVDLNPSLVGFSCDGEVLTRGRRSSLSLRKSGATAEGLYLAVAGTIPYGSEPKSFRVSCDAPGQLAGMRLVDMLQRNGISAPRNFHFAAASPKGKVLVEDKSTALGEILPEINKKSDNFMAEQLIKVLGAEYAGVPGTTPNGARAILRELHATGIKTEGIYLENGSGLSRESRVRAKTLVEVLQKAYDNPRLRREFMASLSVLGMDGTLRRKFRNSELAGRFIGKTGTLRGVTSLSGYAFPVSGLGEKAYIFAYMINGSGKGFWQQKQAMQRILELLLQ